MERLEVAYDITKFSTATRPLTIKTFTVRETDGKDEDLAAMRAKSVGGSATVLEELIKRSITEVDGKPVNTEEGVPFAAWDTWNSATRSFVTQAYQALNAIVKEDLDFLKQGKPRAR